jgi:hypothetical protein
VLALGVDSRRGPWVDADTALEPVGTLTVPAPSAGWLPHQEDVTWTEFEAEMAEQSHEDPGRGWAQRPKENGL